MRAHVVFLPKVPAERSIGPRRGVSVPVVGRVSIRLERVRTRANGAREPIETRYFLQSITSRHTVAECRSVAGDGVSRVYDADLYLSAHHAVGRPSRRFVRAARRSTLDADRGRRRGEREEGARRKRRMRTMGAMTSDRARRPRANASSTGSSETSTRRATGRRPRQSARERETRSDRVETREGDRESKYHREVSTASERDIAQGGAGRARARGRSRWRGRARDDAGAADDDERLQS